MDITLEQWKAAFDSQTKAFLIGVREAVALIGKGGRILAVTYAQGKPYRRIATLGRDGFSPHLRTGVFLSKGLCRERMVLSPG